MEVALSSELILQDNFVVRLLKLSLTTCALVRTRSLRGAETVQTTATAIALAVCVVIGDGSVAAQYALCARLTFRRTLMSQYRLHLHPPCA